MSIQRIPIAILSLCVVQGTTAAQSCDLERASVSATGAVANWDCSTPSLSFDGRFVAFGAMATNLVPGDVNGQVDVFLKDRLTGAVELISVDSQGNQGNGLSSGAIVSPDGRFVLFESLATNLDPRDTDALEDTYLHDRVTKTTELVSVRAGNGPSVFGGLGTGMTPDGRFVLFWCMDGNVLPGVGGRQAYLRDMWTQTTEWVGAGPQGQFDPNSNYWPSMSSDARYISFVGEGPGWFPAGPNYQGTVFIRDRLLGTLEAVTMTPSGVLADGWCNQAMLSADGRYLMVQAVLWNWVPDDVVFKPGDIVRWDRQTGAFENLNLTPMGRSMKNPNSFAFGISGSGRVGVCISQGSDDTVHAQVGQHVLVRDFNLGATQIASLNAMGATANAIAYLPAVSGDGRVVAFLSDATNLVPGANGVTHVYVRECKTTAAMTYCKPSQSAGGCTTRLDFSGVPQASAASGFVLQGSGLPGQQPWVLLFSAAGSWGAPVSGGFLCVKPPFKRAANGSSNGSGSTACDGAFAFDVNAAVQSGQFPALPAGAKGFAQAWVRDPAGGALYTEATAFEVQP